MADLSNAMWKLVSLIQIGDAVLFSMGKNRSIQYGGFIAVRV